MSDEQTDNGQATTEAAGTPGEGQAAAPEKKPAEPWDIVRAVERYIATTIEDAESPEDEVAANVLKQRSSVARLEIAMLRIEKAKKQLKERLEEEVELLDSMERSAASDAEQKRVQPDLPFGEKPAANGEQPPAPADDESWRSVRLEDLEPKIRPGKLKVLLEHEPSITTLGALVDFQGSAGEWWWKSVKGLGEGGVEQIADACSRYWADHPREQRAPPAKLIHRVPTEEEVESGNFAPESAAHFIAFLAPNAARPEGVEGGVEPLADLILNDAAAFQTVWAGVEAVRPGTPDHEAKSPFNEDGWWDLLKAAAVLRQHHGLVANQVEQALDTPDPAGIDPLTTQRVVSFLGDNSRFSIDVGLRPGGRHWAAQHAAQIGDGRKNVLNSTGYQGRHVTRAEAITAAADAIDEWAKGLRGTSSSVTAGVKEIRAELDRLDKQYADDPGSAVAENREAVAAAV